MGHFIHLKRPSSFRVKRTIFSKIMCVMFCFGNCLCDCMSMKSKKKRDFTNLKHLSPQHSLVEGAKLFIPFITAGQINKCAACGAPRYEGAEEFCQGRECGGGR